MFVLIGWLSTQNKQAIYGPAHMWYQPPAFPLMFAQTLGATRISPLRCHLVCFSPSSSLFLPHSCAFLHAFFVLFVRVFFAAIAYGSLVVSQSTGRLLSIGGITNSSGFNAFASPVLYINLKLQQSYTWDSATFYPMAFGQAFGSAYLLEETQQIIACATMTPAYARSCQMLDFSPSAVNSHWSAMSSAWNLPAQLHHHATAFF